MDKQKSLDVLEEVHKQMESMTEDELFNYMKERSPSFRKWIEKNIKKDKNIKTKQKKLFGIKEAE